MPGGRPPIVHASGSHSSYCRVAGLLLSCSAPATGHTVSAESNALASTAALVHVVLLGAGSSCAPSCMSCRPAHLQSPVGCRAAASSSRVRRSAAWAHPGFSRVLLVGHTAHAGVPPHWRAATSTSSLGRACIGVSGIHGWARCMGPHAWLEPRVQAMRLRRQRRRPLALWGKAICGEECSARGGVCGRAHRSLGRRGACTGQACTAGSERRSWLMAAGHPCTAPPRPYLASGATRQAPSPCPARMMEPGRG